jgi:hypothetical protein
MTSKMVDWKIHTDLTCVETIQYDAVGGLDFQSTIFEALDNLAQQVYYYAILELINLTIFTQHFDKSFGNFITGPYWNAYPMT